MRSATTVTIRDGGCTATIAPELGFNCFAFQAAIDGRNIDVLDSHPGFADGGQRPSGNGIPILFPFPNRIRDGRFSWEARDYQVPHSPGHPNALHGFALDRPWRVVAQGANTVTGQFQLSRDAPDRAGCWPADAMIEVRYTLALGVLRSDFRITNPDSIPLPWGLGTHAYFRIPLSPRGDRAHFTIAAPAHRRWELADLLPTGETTPIPPEKDVSRGVSLGNVVFDDVFTDLRPQGGVLTCVMMDGRAGIEILQGCDPVFRELVVFTPPGRDAVCMEPYTCVTDAVNLHARGIDAGWRVLPPGGEFRTWIEIAARPVLA